MSTYKLTYFNGKGRAELTRLVFAQAEVPYTDERLTGEEWAQRAPHTPFGVLPVLEVDGKQIGGSLVMARYVAEKHGVAGADALENALIAAVLDGVSDLQTEMYTWWFEKDETKKAELKKGLVESTIPSALANFEKIIAANGSGWVVGTKATYGDFGVYLLLEQLLMFESAVLDKFPALAGLKKNVESLPRIAKWIQTRPQTQF